MAFAGFLRTKGLIGPMNHGNGMFYAGFYKYPQTELSSGLSEGISGEGYGMRAEIYLTQENKTDDVRTCGNRRFFVPCNRSKYKRADSGRLL